MNATVETKIWLALKSRIDTLPLDFPVAWPGVRFDIPHSGDSILPYIRSGRVVANPIRDFIANGQPYTRTGTLILTLVYPLSTLKSSSTLDYYGGIIADHFSDSKSMQYNDVCVTIPSYPTVSDGYEDNGYFNIPVRIPWRCSA